ncbi:alpha/beta hydrolase [Oceanobacillus piezotolerans]|uniref:Alpha/beta hydrolase n=1 Tax=Oceanobacillus piezotolerans TaxID=2448030 RepID=A0A498DAL6_9BACI|nr:alpha/beta hydrolase [Oceanobacillus piezotolerans]RLL46618.1 alpha/beta hydrolase [Oceanobacillus piezotolerans]
MVYILTYTDIGKGVPIVFIHGLGNRKEMWRFQHKLSENYRLILVDLRGHGETEIEKDITMFNFAKDIIELLEHLEVDRVFICGLSLGGLVAQEICKQKPDVVRGLILANTTTYIPYMANIMVSQFINKSKEDIIDAVMSWSLFNKKLEKEARSSFFIRDAFYSCAKAPIGINYTKHLLTMRKPMLIISGTHDMVTPMFYSLSMYLMTCNSKFVSLNAGHLSNIEKPEEFNRSINNFIKDVS